MKKKAYLSHATATRNSNFADLRTCVRLCASAIGTRVRRCTSACPDQRNERRKHSTTTRLNRKQHKRHDYERIDKDASIIEHIRVTRASFSTRSPRAFASLYRTHCKVAPNESNDSFENNKERNKTCSVWPPFACGVWTAAIATTTTTISDYIFDANVYIYIYKLSMPFTSKSPPHTHQ